MGEALESEDFFEGSLANPSSTGQADLQAVFKHMDANGDNYLSADEIRNLLNKVGFRKKGGKQFSNSDVKSIMSALDENSDELLDFNEFVSLFKDENDGSIVTTMTDQVLMDVFQIMDTDGSGFLEIDELKEVYQELGITLDAKDISYLIHEIDQNNDGKIDIKEFTRMVNAKFDLEE